MKEMFTRLKTNHEKHQTRMLVINVYGGIAVDELQRALEQDSFFSSFTSTTLTTTIPSSSSSMIFLVVSYDILNDDAIDYYCNLEESSILPRLDR